MIDLTQDIYIENYETLYVNDKYEDINSRGNKFIRKISNFIKFIKIILKN